MMQHRTVIRSLFAASLLSAGNVMAGPTPPPPTEPAASESSVFDKIWGLATLYKDDSNHFLEEIDLVGRYQGQYYDIGGDGNNADDWDHRRTRIGLKAKMFDKRLEFYGEAFFDFNPDTYLYGGFKNFNLAWKFSDAFVLTVGKMEPKFSYDYSMSDTLMLNFERNALINQFKIDYNSGVTVSGKIDKWSYYAGIFSNQADKTFGDFDGGYTESAFVSYDLKDAFKMDKAVWRLDYMHSNHKTGDTLFTGFDNGVATSLDLKQGPWGLTTEVLAGFGDADTFGVRLVPTYDINKKLQLVARYQYATSNKANGLAPQGRYEGIGAGATRGDNYNAIYLGLNYYIYGHKLKLMNGVEYASMDQAAGGNFNTWTWMSGIRLYF
ncbi:MAG TPA: porin [Verrucomicrobiales bacterium]|nr:porin [Verrucomicrobiales bacterium]